MVDKLPILSQTTLQNEATRRSDGGNLISPAMKWVPLVHSNEEVEEPNNIIKCHAHTVPEEEAGSMPKKYNYNITFNREDIKGTFDPSL
eukprot:9594333-Ditylum_brightwellii.AAC.1